jgi:hypothetical protein
MGKRWRWPFRVDLDAVAGVVAALVALILHLLDLVHEEVVLAVILVLLALLMVRDLRREVRDERVEDLLQDGARRLERVEGAVQPREVSLVGPQALRQASERFAQRARGEMVWFNVCLLMFRPQSLFDSLLRPAIENPAVTAIEFVLDAGERERWEADVMPKVRACRGAEKVREPRFVALDEAISFVLADTVDGPGTEAQVSFWGEPFMSRRTGMDIPRYVLHAHAGSELINHLYDLERRVRMGG